LQELSAYHLQEGWRGRGPGLTACTVPSRPAPPCGGLLHTHCSAACRRSGRSRGARQTHVVCPSRGRQWRCRAPARSGRQAGGNAFLPGIAHARACSAPGLAGQQNISSNRETPHPFFASSGIGGQRILPAGLPWPGLADYPSPCAASPYRIVPEVRLRTIFRRPGRVGMRLSPVRPRCAMARRRNAASGMRIALSIPLPGRERHFVGPRR